MMRVRELMLALVAISLVWPAQAATVQTVSIHSKKMDKDIPASVILPDAYTNSTGAYPVLYLLHGVGGNYKNWPENLDIEQFADQYDIVMCCPDGDKASWYFDSPIDPGSQYETFVAKECVEYMDKNFRTLTNRSERAICGLSMGGHGALFLAIRHRDVFASAVGLSAGADIRPFSDAWGIKDRIGDIATHKDNWEQLTVMNVAKDLKDGDLAISLDCGTRDFFLDVNRKLHEQLQQNGIQHEYCEHSGRHSWKYWNQAIARQIHFIARQFRKD